MNEQKIIFIRDLKSEIQELLASSEYDKLFILTDSHTQEMCYPFLKDVPALQKARLVTIEAGDLHKELEQVLYLWNILSREGASRNSLLINLGGGMVTDLGGFAGATFKRGLHTLNIPTTLMASVDAAVGGKTGINFNGLKNEIGAFHQPDYVLIDCTFLRTLDQDNLLSGYAEMIKHGLISSTQTWSDVLTFEPDVRHPDIETLNRLVAESVAVKERIVAEDPQEYGIRKALNLGHTIGHAFESLSFERKRPMLHGHAVAAGLICELYLSHKCCAFPVETLRQTIHFIKTCYSPFVFDCNDYDTLYELMTHDKKNENGKINFTLLAQIGEIRINQTIDKEIVFDAFDFYRETSL
ncbi:MAG: 3-dehydroquinate synthase [Tannerella sp.]|jgi:3-dehydroquinate synthase|nr:3-dehydroquinate synthase [Tannerella sp.]